MSISLVLRFPAIVLWAAFVWMLQLECSIAMRDWHLGARKKRRSFCRNLIIVLFVATCITWAFVAFGNGDEPEISAVTYDGLFTKLNSPFDASELEWLLTHWPTALFLVDPDLLGCVTRTASKYGVHFCLGLVFQKDVLTLGSREVSMIQLNNFTVAFGRRHCLVSESLQCGGASSDFSSPPCTNSLEAGKPTHVLLQRDTSLHNSQLMHIVIFHGTFDKSWKISELSAAALLRMDSCRSRNKMTTNKPRSSAANQDFFYGKYDTILDRLELVETHSDVLVAPLLIPRTPMDFIEKASVSNLVRCNTTAAKHFTSRSSNASVAENNVFRMRAERILRRTKRILDDMGIPWWICSGTLLGWYRQCDIIPYAEDVDIGIFIRDYDENIAQNFERRGFDVAYRLGKVNDSLQLSFALDETKLDIYFFYEAQGVTWNGATAYKAGQKFRYDFLPFTLCWTSFLRQLMRVPCDPLQYIVANYGANWSTAEVDWDWRTSPPNSRLNGFWTEAERASAIYLNPKFYDEPVSNSSIL